MELRENIGLNLRMAGWASAGLPWDKQIDQSGSLQ